MINLVIFLIGELAWALQYKPKKKTSSTSWENAMEIVFCIAQCFVLLECIVYQEELSSWSQMASSRSNVIRNMTARGKNLLCQHRAQNKAVRNQMWSKDKKSFNTECYKRMDISQGIKVCTQKSSTEQT